MIANRRRGALVLNASFEPLLVVDWKKAIILIFTRKVEVLAEYPIEIRSPTTSLNLPAVVRLTRMVRRKSRLRVPLTRRNVFLRDNLTCQYDGKVFSMDELTVDHVIPRSHGGMSTWDNVVACCESCNRKKGSMAPELAGMQLARKPRAPNPTRLLTMKIEQDRVPGIWEPFLTPWDSSRTGT